MQQENSFRKKWALAGFIIDFLQVFAFTFSRDYGWGPEYDQVMTFIVGPISAIDWTAYQIIFWITIALLTAAFGISYYVGYSFRNSEYQQLWPIKFLRTVVNAAVTILFIPITTILMASLRTNSDGTGLLTRFASAGIVAFGPESTVYAVTSIIFMALFVPYCLLMGLLNFEVSPKSSDIMARSTSRLDFVYLILKTMLVLVTDLAAEQIAFRAIFLPILMLYVVGHISIAVPYYRPWVNLVRTTLFGATLGAAIDVIFGLYVNPARSISVAMVQHFGFAIAGGALCAFVMWMRIQRNQRAVSQGRAFWMRRMITQRQRGQNNSASPPQAARRGTSAGPDDISLRSLRSASVQPGARTAAQAGAEIKKYGNLQGMWHGVKHFFAAMEAQISIIFLKKKSNQDAVDLADAIFQQYVDKSPRALLLRVLYANFIVNYKNDWVGCAVQVQRVRAMNPGFDLRWLIFVLDKQMERLKRSTQIGADAASGLMSYVEFQHNFAKARKAHLETIRRMRLFWEVLLSEDSMLHKLGDAHKQLVNAETTTIRAYSRLLSTFTSSPLLWRSYASFLIDIRNEKAESDKCFQLADDIEEKQAQRHRKRAAGPYQMQAAQTSVQRETPTELVTPDVAPAEEEEKPAIDRSAVDMETQSETDKSSVHTGSDGRGNKTKTRSSTGSSTSFGRRGISEDAEKRAVITLSRRFFQAFGIILVVLICNNVVLTTLISTQDRNMESVEIAGEIRLEAINLVAHLLFPTMQQYFNGTPTIEGLAWDLVPEGITESRKTVHAYAHDLIHKGEHLWKESHHIDEELVEYWELHHAPLRDYPSENLIMYPLADAFDMFERRTERLLASIDNGRVPVRGIPADSDFKFIVENGLQEMQTLTDDLVDHYLDVFAFVTSELQTIVIIVASFCVVLITFLGLAVFRPAIHAIHGEKHLTLSLFLLIPHHDVVIIVQRLRAIEMKAYEEQEGDGSGDETEAAIQADEEKRIRALARRKTEKRSDRTSSDSAKQELYAHRLAVSHAKSCKEMTPVFGKTFIALALLALIIGGHCVTMVLGIMNDIQMAKAINYGISRQDLFSELVVLSMARVPAAEALFHGHWDPQHLAEEAAGHFWEIHFGLLIGNSSMGLDEASLYTSIEIQNHTEHVLEPQIDKVLHYIDNLMYYNESTINYQLEEYKIIAENFIEPATLTKMMDHSRKLQSAQFKTQHAAVLSQNTIWLVVEVVMIAAVSVVLLRSIIRTLSEDMDSVHRVLRLTPMDTIRKSDTIRHYLMDPEQFRDRLETRVAMAKKWENKTEQLGSEWSLKLVDRYPDGIVAFDHKGRIVFANNAIENRFGRSEEDLVGSVISALWSPLYRTQFDTALKSMGDGDRDDKSVLDMAGEHKNGSTFAIRVTLRSVKSKSSGIGARHLFVAIIPASTDQGAGVGDTAWITHCLESTSQMIIMTAAGDVTNISPKAAELLRVSDAEDKPFATLLEESAVTEESRPKLERLVERAVGMPGQQHVAEAQLSVAGRLRDISVTIELVKMGAQRRLVAQIQDVSEARAVERSTHESQFIMAEMAEFTDHAVVVTSGDDSVILANQSAAQLLGVEKGSELIGLHTGAMFDRTTPLGHGGEWKSNVLRRVNGERIAVEARARQTPCGTDDGRVACVIQLRRIERPSPSECTDLGTPSMFPPLSSTVVEAVPEAKV